ncbi:uncharacterized protein WM277_025784 isoform 1-T8 [Molossus nigricans]
MAGPEEPGGGAGRAATPRSPSACEPAGARGGRGLAPHGSAAAAAARTAAGTQEAARLGAGAGHIPRRRRLRGSCSAPAAAAAPQWKGAGGGGGGASPCPSPPASRAQSLSRSLSRAAASSAPRASPIRLPAPSAAPRGRLSGGGQNEAGPYGARPSLRGVEPISRWHRGRALLRGERAPGAEGPDGWAGSQHKWAGLLPDAGDPGEALGVASCLRWERNPKPLMVSYCSDSCFLSKGKRTQ